MSKNIQWWFGHSELWNMNLEFQLYSPVLFKIISVVFDDQIAVAVISVIIQKQKNIHVCISACSITSLDNGGATDEVFTNKIVLLFIREYLWNELRITIIISDI